jgi:hypothetical protein
MLFAVVLFGSTLPPPRQLTEQKKILYVSGQHVPVSREKKDNHRYKEVSLIADGGGGRGREKIRRQQINRGHLPVYSFYTIRQRKTGKSMFFRSALF